MIKYILIWMVSLGIAAGSVSDRGYEFMSDNVLFSIVAAPLVASVAVTERIFND